MDISFWVRYSFAFLWIFWFWILSCAAQEPEEENDHFKHPGYLFYCGFEMSLCNIGVAGGAFGIQTKTKTGSDFLSIAQSPNPSKQWHAGLPDKHVYTSIAGTLCVNLRYRLISSLLEGFVFVKTHTADDQLDETFKLLAGTRPSAWLDGYIQVKGNDTASFRRGFFLEGKRCGPRGCLDIDYVHVSDGPCPVDTSKSTTGYVYVEGVVPRINRKPVTTTITTISKTTPTISTRRSPSSPTTAEAQSSSKLSESEGTSWVHFGYSSTSPSVTATTSYATEVTSTWKSSQGTSRISGGVMPGAGESRAREHSHVDGVLVAEITGSVVAGCLAAVLVVFIFTKLRYKTRRHSLTSTSESTITVLTISETASSLSPDDVFAPQLARTSQPNTVVGLRVSLV